MIVRVIKYFFQKFKSSFKHRIGTNVGTQEHMYYNVWTGKTWLEKY